MKINCSTHPSCDKADVSCSKITLRLHLMVSFKPWLTSHSSPSSFSLWKSGAADLTDTQHKGTWTPQWQKENAGWLGEEKCAKTTRKSIWHVCVCFWKHVHVCFLFHCTADSNRVYCLLMTDCEQRKSQAIKEATKEKRGKAVMHSEALSAATMQHFNHTGKTLCLQTEKMYTLQYLLCAQYVVCFHFDIMMMHVCSIWGQWNEQNGL